jgi:hypothetical protein
MGFLIWEVAQSCLLFRWSFCNEEEKMKPSKEVVISPGLDVRGGSRGGGQGQS